METSNNLMQALLDSYGFPPGTTFDHWFALDGERIITVAEYISSMES